MASSTTLVMQSTPTILVLSADGFELTLGVAFPVFAGQPTGPAGGDLSGNYPDPAVSAIDGLDIGAIADGQYLKRVGTDIVGASAEDQNLKAGLLIPGSFSGAPFKASVVFTTAYTVPYAITVRAETINNKSFALEYENKTASGFDINLNSNNIANLVEVSWIACSSGE